MGAKRVRIPESVINFSGDEYDGQYSEEEKMTNKVLGNVLKKMTNPILLTGVTEENDPELYLTLNNELVATQVFETKEGVWQFSSLRRESDEYLPIGSREIPDGVTVIVFRGDYDKYYVSATLPRIKRIRELTEVAPWPMWSLADMR